MRRPIVAGNWKMNGSRTAASSLARAVTESLGDVRKVDVLLCPPDPYLGLVVGIVKDAAVHVGAQDCSDFEVGAYTGETAASMLRDIGCSHVILGHSERRQYFGDSDRRIQEKLQRALSVDLSPIVCVGETLVQRQRNETEKTVGIQLETLMNLPDCADVGRNMIIAYEPVWAIGTGLSASPEEAQNVHAWIRAQLAEFDDDLAESTRILYGGSVKPENARGLFAMPDIDGGLIGGAALDAESFVAICEAAN